MRHALLAVSAVLGFMGSAGLGTPASADPSLYPPLVHVPQGVGCYWFRGSLHCNRYCYWEVDGRRFCQRRARDAVTQAPPALFEPPDDDDVRYRTAAPRAPRSTRFLGSAGGGQ